MLNKLIWCWLLMICAGPALADSFPSKPIRIVVPFPAASGGDQIARALQRPLQQELGQPIVVENKAGALGLPGATEVARSAPDGYTLLIGTNTTQAANLFLFKKLPYDPVKDFVPLVLVGATPMVLLVRNDMPARTAEEMFALARSRDRPLAGGYGTAASQVAVAKLQRTGGFRGIDVPYRGTPAQLADLLAGQIDYTFTDLPTALPMLSGGRLKALGLTAARPVAFAPDLVPLARAYPAIDVTGWYGMFAPASTPPAVAQRLSQALTNVMALPEVREELARRFIDTSVSMGPAPFADFLAGQVDRWRRDIQEAGIEAQ